MSTRGEHLVRADRGFATGGGVLARAVAPAFLKVLDEIAVSSSAESKRSCLTERSVASGSTPKGPLPSYICQAGSL
jgi:cyclopropane-fatty-acyl-phospholipid synthase